MSPAYRQALAQVTINQLAEMAMSIVGKKLSIKHVPGPTGVRGRNSDNKLIRQKLGWDPTMRLRQGIEKNYKWIDEQVKRANLASVQAVVGK